VPVIEVLKRHEAQRSERYDDAQQRDAPAPERLPPAPGTDQHRDPKRDGDG
jgi:hypothetical protein